VVRAPRALAVVVGAATVLTVSSMSGEAAPAPGRALVAATPPQEPTTPTIRLTLIGRSSNRSAYGAQVRVFSGGIEQLTELRGSDGYIGSNDPRLLIHLPSGIADRIEIDWPSGARTTLEREPAGQIVVDERRGVIARR